MRRFLLAAGVLGLSMSGAAYAQATCEASAFKDGFGEVIAAYELDKTGQVTKLVATFIPERKEDVGQESDNFGRPSMMLDYRYSSDGALAGPTNFDLLISRFQNPGAAAAPPLSSVEARATMPGIDPIKWAANSNDGEKTVAEAIRDKAPKSITTEVLSKAGKVLAGSQFDLSKTAELQKMATEAKADGDKKVAAFAKLAAEGKAGNTCPAS